jgi:[ribosomal protein S5]-alanine N-acetyltransferase
MIESPLNRLWLREAASLKRRNIMALRLFAPSHSLVPPLETTRLVLRSPVMEHFEMWGALRRESRSFLEPWEPEWASDELTRGSFRRRLKRYAEEIDRDEGYPYFLFLKDGGQLVGGITLGHIRRGVSQTGTIGYWMGKPFAARGLMAEALRAITHASFAGLKLNRLEAACVPENDASRLLLQGCGFQQEGYARRYLKIAGEWRDHLLFAKVSGDDVGRQH